MNELSERIKREALEFMNFESSYADEKEKLMGGRGGRHDERVDDTTVIVSGEEPSEYSFASNGGELRGSFLDDGGSELNGIQEEEEHDESLSSNNSNQLSPKKQPLGGNNKEAHHNNFPTTSTAKSTVRKTPDSV